MSLQNEMTTQSKGEPEQDPVISFGDNIRAPSRLREERMGDVFSSIVSGRWADEVQSVRKLPYHSLEQTALKEQLPYWMPSGLFKHKSSRGLIRHSGHVAIDLDELGIDRVTRAIQTAVDDPHCKCAFRSVSAHGVRLIFLCPPCDAETHKTVYNRIAGHVTAQYGVEVDKSGSDVARACFVTVDGGLWLNPQATILPGLVELVSHSQSPTTHKDFRSLCVVGTITDGDINTLAYGLGETRAPHAVKPDGTCFTHESIRDLARDLVVRFRRHHLDLTRAEIDRAFQAWWVTGKRNGMKFRHPDHVYRDELISSVRAVQGVPWLDRVVSFWPRWTGEPGFPRKGSSDERLQYAIRAHCAETQDPRFFRSARDAATITGTCFKAANDTLHRLVKAGVLERDGKRLRARDAQGYRLISMT